MNAAVARPRIYRECRILGTAILRRDACLWSKVALAAGLLYLFVPLDLIPDRLPVVGHLDEAAAIVGGAVLARLLIPASFLRTLQDMGEPSELTLRLATLTMLAVLFARPLLRLATGRWPRLAEAQAFRRCFVLADTAPPLLRALAGVPAARRELTRTMVASWLDADEASRAHVRQELGSGTPLQGDRLRVWLGQPVSFLHLEKTAGMSLASCLTGLFHPLQIDPDPHRRFPPHMLSPFPPCVADKVRRYPLVWGHYDLPSLRRLGADRFTLTVLREPRERIISLYHYWRENSVRGFGSTGYNRAVLIARDSTLLEFLRSEDLEVRGHLDSFYVRRLIGVYETGVLPDPVAADPDGALAQALVALDSIDFVGMTEQLDEALAVLGRMLDFEPPLSAPRLNITGRRASGSQTITGPFQRDTDAAAIRSELDHLTRLDRVVYEAAQVRFERLIST